MHLVTLIGAASLAAVILIGFAHILETERTICAHCGSRACDGVQCVDDAPIAVPVGPAESDLLAPWRAFIESL